MKPRQPAFERCQIRRKRQMRNEKEFPVRFTSKRAVFSLLRLSAGQNRPSARENVRRAAPKGAKKELLWQDTISSPPSP